MKYRTRARMALPPVLATAALAALIAGCTKAGGTAQVPTDDGTAMSAAASPDGMVPSDDGTGSSSSDGTGMPIDSDSSSPQAAATGKSYADGTFTATGDYRSPAGAEQVNVSLTLKDGIVTDATFEGTATAPRSKMMQGQFADGFKEQVIGKPIDTLALTVVNGSSLTPMGFMDAVTKIKAQAKA